MSTVGAEAIETDKGGPLAGVGDDSSADETVGGKEAITPAERRSTADGRRVGQTIGSVWITADGGRESGRITAERRSIRRTAGKRQEHGRRV